MLASLLRATNDETREEGSNDMPPVWIHVRQLSV